VPDRWVALLRGVNVGGRNRVPMAELRRVLADTGCEDVSTYIQSGNVVFRCGGRRAALARELEAAIAAAFGVPSRVVLRSGQELRALVDAHPFGTDTSHTYVTFLAEKPKRAALARLAELDVAPDRYELVGGDVVVQYPNGVQGSKLTTALLERQLGVAGTNRNWRTVTRLAELAT
jgi:uncharacterized protein (DUF1697 family)